jgi:hypothetical protein
MPDLANSVFISLVDRDIRPPAFGLVLPRAISHKCDFGRQIAESGNVKIVEILQFLGANK